MQYKCEQKILTFTTKFEELRGIKLLCSDVDGVLTDGGLYYNANGQELLKFSVLDGLGLQKLQAVGVQTCFISKSNNDIIRVRAEKLGIDHVFVGIDDKKTTIIELISKLGINFENVAHIADDVNDIDLLQEVGYRVCVPNAVDEVKHLCDYTTSRSGGNGAVRELCDNIINSYNIDN